LRYQFIQRGDGKQAEAGKTVSVHYEGSLETEKCLTSYPRKPIEFKLGIGQVIEGWDEGSLY
jgi:peptidyl-prolyl cis-trans isomerase A (cyclophilin A)